MAAKTNERMPRRMMALAAVVVLSISTCIVAIAAGWVDLEVLKKLIADRTPATMVTYVATVYVLEMLWFPRAWGLLAGGLAFGPLLGAALSVIADMATAVTCYVVARGSGREWVALKMQRTPRLANVVEVLARERGMVTVFLLRVMPIHFTAVGYAAGLAGVGVRPYLVGCVLGILPTALLYTFVGDAAREPGSPIFIAGVAVVVALGLGGILYVRRLWKSQPTPLRAAPRPPEIEPAALE